jgi:hypothetical protein
LLAVAATVGFGWLMITDADSVRKGFDFCKANYIDGTMCNPVKYTHTVREECTCDFINFISITLMDAGGIVLWVRYTLILTNHADFCCNKRNLPLLRIQIL